MEAGGGHVHRRSGESLIIPLFEQMLNCKEIIEGLAKVLKKHTGQ